MAIKHLFLNGSRINVGSQMIYFPVEIKVVPGGTATGVEVQKYTPAQEATYKGELVTAGTITAEEAENASVLNITGTSAGTVILDVANLGDVGDPIVILHKKQDNSWETLYNGNIPANKQVTVTVTEFSPFVGCKKESTPTEPGYLTITPESDSLTFYTARSPRRQP